VVTDLSKDMLRAVTEALDETLGWSGCDHDWYTTHLLEQIAERGFVLVEENAMSKLKDALRTIETLPGITPTEASKFSFLDADLEVPPDGLHASYFVACGYNVALQHVAGVVRRG
jgi:hypothetical protein